MRPTLRTGARVARPLVGLGRLSGRPALTVLGWHRIDPDGGSLSTSLATFRAQLDTLTDWGATVLPLNEAVERLTTGDLPERAVALTFDDGYASVVERAWPELHGRHLPATLFAVSGYLDGRTRFPWDADAGSAEYARLADRVALREASDAGLDVGSHTVSHRWLPHLGADEVKRELVDSRAQLEDEMGRPIRSLAYPMGGWSPAVRDAAAAAGYSHAITVDRGTNRVGQHRLSLRRSFVPDSLVDFRLVLDGAYDWLRPLDRWRSRQGPAW